MFAAFNIDVGWFVAKRTIMTNKTCGMLPLEFILLKCLQEHRSHSWFLAIVWKPCKETLITCSCFTFLNSQITHCCLPAVYLLTVSRKCKRKSSIIRANSLSSWSDMRLLEFSLYFIAVDKMFQNPAVFRHISIAEISPLKSHYESLRQIF